MRAIQISSTDVRGGAALAANRLSHGLREQGVDSSMYVAQAASPDRYVQPFHLAGAGWPALDDFVFRAARRLQRRVTFPDGMLFTLDWTILGGLVARQLPSADIYHLHWVADFIDFQSLSRMARRAPLVWTFHDMNAFTGGCHYDGGCGRFAAACGACPMLHSSDPADITNRTHRRKARALGKIPRSRLVVVTPSNWLAGEVRRSSLFGQFDTRVIPNGIDLDLYTPVDRLEVRRRLGLEQDSQVVLFVADTLRDSRKGFSALSDALEPLLSRPQLRILTIGSGDTQAMSGPQYRHLGSLQDPVAIRDAYNAADVFVIPTLQDNFPNTVIESLACGTPVAGFATGGVVDSVEHGVCGLLAPTGDIPGLSQSIRALLDDGELRRSKGRAARDRAVALYGDVRQAQAHLALYKEMLGQSHSLSAAVDRSILTPVRT